ncbi:hypothetical protein HK102_005128 [Quaeritorhiza haematococci]|nr:hypothetical protein HK102_005128 [Quaeritorhiza haematococci]
MIDSPGDFMKIAVISASKAIIRVGTRTTDRRHTVSDVAAADVGVGDVAGGVEVEDGGVFVTVLGLVTDVVLAGAVPKVDVPIGAAAPLAVVFVPDVPVAALQAEIPAGGTNAESPGEKMTSGGGQRDGAMGVVEQYVSNAKTVECTHEKSDFHQSR